MVTTERDTVIYPELRLDVDQEAIGRVRGVVPQDLIDIGVADEDDDPFELVAIRELVDGIAMYQLTLRSLDDPETDPHAFSHAIELDWSGWLDLRQLCDRVILQMSRPAPEKSR